MSKLFKVSRTTNVDSRPGRFYCNLSVIDVDGSVVCAWIKVIVAGECVPGDGSPYDRAMTEATALCKKLNRGA